MLKQNHKHSGSTMIFFILICFTVDATQHQWAILHYLSSEPITKEVITPIIAYVDDRQEPIDWLFDSVIVYDISLGEPSQSDADQYAYDLFEGKSLETLADTVADLRLKLDDPKHKLGIWLAAIPVYGDVVTQSLDLQVRFEALDRDELELLGFYWGDESVITSDQSHIVNFTDKIRDLGLKTLWIPYHGTEGSSNWTDFGFDYATLQPNYAFRNVSLDQFQDTDDKVHSYKLSGIELEFGPVHNNEITDADPEQSSALSYLWAAEHFGWTQNQINTCYHSSEVSDYASNIGRREIYDNLYKIISAWPGKETVLETISLPVIDDTYTQSASGYESVNDGIAEKLRLGTNSYPNAIRAWLKFNLSQLPPKNQIMAIYLMIAQYQVPYGDSVDDAEIWVVDSNDWDESTLTNSNQPNSTLYTFITSQRYKKETIYPRWRSAQVTEAVFEAQDMERDEISFMLKRASENGVESEVDFYSKEHGNQLEPKLFVLYNPQKAETTQDTSIPDTSETNSPCDSVKCEKTCSCNYNSSTTSTILLLLSLFGIYRRSNHETQ